MSTAAPVLCRFVVPLGVALGLVVAAGITRTAHRRVLAYEHVRTGESAALVPLALLKRLALNQPEALADLYYLRAINSFGDKKEHSRHYPLVQPLLWRASTLDPKFLGPYLLGGQAASILGYDVDLALALLERGRQARPERWHIPFYEGFVAYYWKHDDVRAAAALGHAASFADAPPQLAGLAATLAASAATPEVGLTLLEALLRQPMDENRRDELMLRRNKLLLEVELRALTDAKQTFEDHHKRPLKDLEELVRDGLLSRVPEDPLGGVYELTADGRIVTQHESERLHLADDARAKRNDADAPPP